VYDAANARMMIDSFGESRSERSGLDQTSFMLRHEGLIDRMAGYACHLERIDATVFDPHRDYYVDYLGFCPSDAVRLVRRHVTETNRRLHDARYAMVEIAPRIDAATEEDDLEALARDEHVIETFHAMHTAMEIPYRWSATMLAETTGIAETEIAALLARLSVPFGSQPEFRTPFDVNLARTHPLVDLDDGNYFAPLPWTVAHNVHTIMQAIARDDPSFANRYQRHRSAGTARLLYDGLAGVFGTDRTHASQHFVASDGPGEIDTLVAGARAVIAEAKSQALTDTGRRGHRPRIERVADDAIEKALSQTERAGTHIMSEGGRSFAASEGGNPRRPPAGRRRTVPRGRRDARTDGPTRDALAETRESRAAGMGHERRRLPHGRRHPRRPGDAARLHRGPLARGFARRRGHHGVGRTRGLPA
jgi:hypothetical protein